MNLLCLAKANVVDASGEFVPAVSCLHIILSVDFYSYYNLYNGYEAFKVRLFSGDRI